MGSKKAKASKDKKTNVMRLLDQANITYTSHNYESTGAISGVEVAAVLGQDPDRTFKTLVTHGRQEHYVFIVPVAAELDLKKAASAVGEKSIEMIKQKELLPLTGYVHGGCSPIGMKKRFPSYIHESAAGLAKIFVSAGRVGCQAELSPSDLIRIAELVPADLV
jgi:Cys-tRNA(Pro)/Cys-tRNA(Cys) deacylase